MCHMAVCYPSRTVTYLQKYLPAVSYQNLFPRLKYTHVLLCLYGSYSLLKMLDYLAMPNYLPKIFHRTTPPIYPNVTVCHKATLLHPIAPLSSLYHVKISNKSPRISSILLRIAILSFSSLISSVANSSKF